jgi:hypothetical protein
MWMFFCRVRYRKARGVRGWGSLLLICVLSSHKLTCPHFQRRNGRQPSPLPKAEGTLEPPENNHTLCHGERFLLHQHLDAFCDWDWSLEIWAPPYDSTSTNYIPCEPVRLVRLRVHTAPHLPLGFWGCSALFRIRQFVANSHAKQRIPPMLLRNSLSPT